MTEASDLRRQLNAVFAYKAEWLKEDIFLLFSEPNYFPELLTHYPCVLIGGRGTGKTTVLRGLSYAGRFALANEEASSVANWKTYGFYHRIDTNRVTAFQGPEVTLERWQKLFAHYVNLLLADIVFEFLDWYSRTTGRTVQLEATLCRRIATSLCMQQADSLAALQESLRDALVEFESHVNNIADAPPIRLSMQGAPLDLIFRSLTSTPEFAGKRFSFLLDEYENLNSEQQRVVNTLIKHASDVFVFKIGIRELGWKCKTTLNPDEQLVSPADYRLIDIPTELSGSTFTEFASKVCGARLARIRASHPSTIGSMPELLPGLSLEQEAERLGIKEQSDTLRALLEKSLAEHEMEFVRSLSDVHVYMLQYWAEGQRTSPEAIAKRAMVDRSWWETTCVNHSYAMLFTLRRRKSGIRKHYCGWQTFTHLAASNIRYLLEMADTSLVAHLAEANDLSTPVSADIQTLAAQAVGKKNLAELEGLSTHGAKLTKLLLGLGRVFGVMAADAAGHAPEVSQFELADEQLDPQVDDILRAAVMHLALVRFSGTKPTATDDIRDYDYAIHPVFAPFFVFSYRKKRKIRLQGHELLMLVQTPRAGVESILNRTKRALDEPLPDQLLLFEKYYDGNS